MCKQGQQTATTNNPVSELLVAVSTKWLGAKLKFISQNPLRSMHQPGRQGWKYFTIVCVVCIYMQHRWGASYKKEKKKKKGEFSCWVWTMHVVCAVLPGTARGSRSRSPCPPSNAPSLPKFNSLWRWRVCVCDCVCNIRGKAYKER